MIMAKIKICVGYNEHNATYYNRDFTIVKALPKVGRKQYNGREVLSVRKVRKDPEQPQQECYDYDCFVLSLLPAEESGRGPDEPDLEYVAISNKTEAKTNTMGTANNHMSTMIRIHSIVPSITEANILISTFLCDNQYLSDGVASSRVERTEIIQKYFGISPDAFEDALLEGSLVNAGGFKPVAGENPLCGESELIIDPFYIILRGMVPNWWDESCMLDIPSGEVHAVSAGGAFPVRSTGDLHPEVFRRIVEDCEDLGKDWMADEGFPSWFNLISLNPNEIVEICSQITDVCCSPFRDLLKKAGISQAAFCRKFLISKRTVDDWCSGKNVCKIYLRLLFAEKLGLINRK